MKEVIMPLKKAIKMINKAVDQDKPINDEAWQSVKIALLNTCSSYEDCSVLKGKDAARFLREKFKAEYAPRTKKQKREFKRAKKIYETVNSNSEDNDYGEHSHPDFFRD